MEGLPSEAGGLSRVETEDFQSRIEAALVRGHLSQWQRQFLLDMRDRVAKYGPRTRLSAKQWAKLYEIVGAVPPSAYAQSSSPSDKSRSSPRRRRWRSPLEREASLDIWRPGLPEPLASRPLSSSGLCFTPTSRIPISHGQVRHPSLPLRLDPEFRFNDRSSR